MAKKQKETAAPTPTTPVASRDSLQRLSYLYQASIALSSILPTTNTSVRSAKAARSKGKGRATVRDPAPAQGGETTASGEADRGEGSSKALPERGPPLKRRRRREAGTSEALKPLSRHLAQEMVEVAKKATVRMYVLLFSASQSCILMLVHSTGILVSSAPSAKGAGLS